MKSLLQFCKDWMLPIAITIGVCLYLVYHYTPTLYPVGPICHQIVAKGQQIFIGIMLFLQFVKVAPTEVKVKRWHILLLLFQALTFVGLALIAVYVRSMEAKILLESAMLCLICPTASASGVITDKLGGNISENMTYVALINAMGTFLIPAIVPLVHPSDIGFWANVWIIARRIFPMLLLPCFGAWFVRYAFPKLHGWLSRYTWWAFYLWSIGLIFAMILATRALVLSGLSWIVVSLIGIITFACCFIQFACGHLIGRRYSEVTRITAGQALGQKNTGFLIWLAYSFLTPVTAIAGGLYSIAHNLVNSWELYQKRIS